MQEGGADACPVGPVDGTVRHAVEHRALGGLAATGRHHPTLVSTPSHAGVDTIPRWCRHHPTLVSTPSHAGVDTIPCWCRLVKPTPSHMPCQPAPATGRPRSRSIDACALTHRRSPSSARLRRRPYRLRQRDTAGVVTLAVKGSAPGEATGHPLVTHWSRARADTALGEAAGNTRVQGRGTVGACSMQPTSMQPTSMQHAACSMPPTSRQGTPWTAADERGR
jgi:hypothetical protein